MHDNLSLFVDELSLCPVLGETFTDTPFTVAFTNESSMLPDIDFADQHAVQDYLEQHCYPKASWGLSGYLEFREPLLSFYPQMREQQRYYHLGVDVIAMAGTPLFAPLAGTVHAAGYEPMPGNYGGYVLLQHQEAGETFYTFYGHLNKDTLPTLGTTYGAGQQFCTMGVYECNGNWFDHTHIQLLTPRAFEQGYVSKGYCRETDLTTINTLCPNPEVLIHY